MYYIVFALLLIFSINEACSGKRSPFWFNLIYLIMTLMAMFRYGQMADYFNYQMYFEDYEWFENVEPLYMGLGALCRSLGLGYEGFVMVVSILIMGMSYPFLSKYCHKSPTALLLFYSYIYLVLTMNVVRQGIALSLFFVGFMALINGKKKWFYICIVIGGFFHLSLFFAFFVGFLYNLRIYNNWYIVPAIIGVSIFAFVTPDLTASLPAIALERTLGDYDGDRYMKVILRFLIILPILLIKPKYGSNGYYAKAICIMGYFVYCLLAFASGLSSRMEFYFRAFVCLFVAYVIYEGRFRQFKKGLVMMLILIHSFLFFKNMEAAVSQNGYNHADMMNFPYISIFDKDELQKYQ